MKYTQRASGIIEAMVVLLLLTVWITWVYSILSSSQKLSNSTALRIEAIQIARDGLEAMTNIRNTNWIEFWGDVRNCWNTWNYDENSPPWISCIWDDAWSSSRISHSDLESLIISRDTLTWKFMIDRKDRLSGDFTNSTYRENFWVLIDQKGFYTQTWSLTPPEWSSYNSLWRIFTREIRIDYLNANNISQGSNSPNNPKMEIRVIVQWQDAAVATFRELEVRTILTNWKDRS